ncbi:MAG: 4'-phosphopantetheinyl transferase superfamily protein [Firmicutes bacterium]|nr:4'-phosphopantetheinyl transferase superfamily protein [Bacillota bacterium]
MKKIKDDNINRIFSPSEIEYITRKNNSPQTMAGLYAAKEAFIKASGIPVGHNKLKDIEIIHTQQGAPCYNILDENIGNVMMTYELSISHTKNTAVAVCVALKAQK